jgi:hypothetical protein
MKMHRVTPIEISKEEFTKIGHELIDTIADFKIPWVTNPLPPGQIRQDFTKISN